MKRNICASFLSTTFVSDFFFSVQQIFKNLQSKYAKESIYVFKKQCSFCTTLTKTGMYNQILCNSPNIKFGENLVSVCRVFFFFFPCVQTVTQADGASLISAPQGSERAQSRIKINHLFTAVLPPTAEIYAGLGVRCRNIQETGSIFLPR